MRVVLPALLIAQFIVWPITGLVSPHLGIAATELTLLWFAALYIKRNRLVSEDLLLLNATPHFDDAPRCSDGPSGRLARW